MSGVTKHIFEHEMQDIDSMWNSELKTLEPLLPRKYTMDDVIGLLKEFYPHEWHSVEIKYTYYQIKDRCIKKRYGKNRYNMKPPEMLLKQTSIFRRIMSSEYRAWYYDNYEEDKRVSAREELLKKRKPKIDKVNKKIEVALSKTQQVIPVFIDQLIGLYERKNTSQKDKMYILLEIKKYYSDKIDRKSVV